MITNIAEGVETFTSNAFLVDGDRTVLVDAGANFDAVERIREHVDDLDAVILTHTHPDHVGNVDAIKTAFDVDAWGFDPSLPPVDARIEDEDEILLGDHEYVALHTPGHKNDHLCLYSTGADVLFAGDLVFQNGSFGRTDLEEGDRATLIESITRVLERVDESLAVIHTGHGPSIVTDPVDQLELARRNAELY